VQLHYLCFHFRLVRVGVKQTVFAGVHDIPEMMSVVGSESNDVDINLNEIDDKEFDIPPIYQQPTLESILSVPDDEQSLIDSEVSFAAEFPLPGHAPFVHPVRIGCYYRRYYSFLLAFLRRLGFQT